MKDGMEPKSNWRQWATCNKKGDISKMNITTSEATPLSTVVTMNK